MMTLKPKGKAADSTRRFFCAGRIFWEKTCANALYSSTKNIDLFFNVRAVFANHVDLVDKKKFPENF
jgi:hypothetical protein